MKLIPVQKIMRTHPKHKRLPHDPAYECGCAFITDDFVPYSELKIPHSDAGFHRSAAVYDAISISRGSFFRLAQHQARFARSCGLIRVRNPFSQKKETEMLHRVAANTGLRDAIVWWTVTLGEAPAPYDMNDYVKPENHKNKIYGFCTPYHFICNEDLHMKGIHIIISKRYIQIPSAAVNPHAKNLHWLDFMMGLFEAGDRGGNWSVMTDGTGLLTESPGANIFIVKNGTVRTPGTGCLEGITRLTTIDLCREMGIPCQATQVRVDELRSADEAFITSTAGGIMPVAKVDGARIGKKACPGPTTVKLHNAYWEKRWSGWDTTPVKYELAKS